MHYSVSLLPSHFSYKSNGPLFISLIFPLFLFYTFHTNSDNIWSDWYFISILDGDWNSFVVVLSSTVFFLSIFILYWFCFKNVMTTGCISFMYWYYFTSESIILKAWKLWILWCLLRKLFSLKTRRHKKNVEISNIRFICLVISFILIRNKYRFFK